MYFTREKKVCVWVCVYERPGPSKGLIVRRREAGQNTKKLTHCAEIY